MLQRDHMKYLQNQLIPLRFDLMIGFGFEGHVFLLLTSLSLVEDYYEIIKDPMDFGTMRAKLHEGMYRISKV
ncbi:hypothetical protein P3S68_008055 [Capsicum galapagoense]